jgi:hypothetical protein
MIIIRIIHQEVQVLVVQPLIILQDNKKVIHRLMPIIMIMIIVMEKLKHLLFPVLIIIHTLSLREIFLKKQTSSSNFLLYPFNSTYTHDKFIHTDISSIHIIIIVVVIFSS